MKAKIEISTYGEGYFSGLVRDIEISLNENKQVYQSENISVEFHYPSTVLYFGFTDSLIIAISGGVAAHILNRIIDEIIKVIKKRAHKEKQDKLKAETHPQKDKFELNINHIVIERAKNINIKIKDVDLENEFEIPTEINKCIEHFDKKTKK